MAAGSRWLLRLPLSATSSEKGIGHQNRKEIKLYRIIKYPYAFVITYMYHLIPRSKIVYIAPSESLLDNKYQRLKSSFEECEESIRVAVLEPIPAADYVQSADIIW